MLASEMSGLRGQTILAAALEPVKARLCKKEYAALRPRPAEHYNRHL